MSLIAAWLSPESHPPAEASTFSTVCSIVSRSAATTVSRITMNHAQHRGAGRCVSILDSNLNNPTYSESGTKESAAWTDWRAGSLVEAPAE